jgi:hypothetical protein
METNNADKILRALNPLSCEEARQRFDALLQEKLGGEEEEWAQEHLLVCEECLHAFANRVGQKVDDGEIPLREWPSDLPLPAMELYASSASSYAAAREVVGVVWAEVKQLARQGIEWAKDQLDETQRCLQGAMMLWQMPALAGGSDLSAPGMGATGIAAEVVDDTWQPQGKVVPFEVREGPVVTADGRFTFTLHTPEAQWQGAQAVCTLLLVEGQRVSFESKVEPGGQVQFTAEGLPPLEVEKVEIPLELVHLSLVASH